MEPEFIKRLEIQIRGIIMRKPTHVFLHPSKSHLLNGESQYRFYLNKEKNIAVNLKVIYSYDIDENSSLVCRCLSEGY